MEDKIKIIAIIALAVLCACKDSEEKLARKADRIHASILTVDSHADTPLEFDKQGLDLGVWNSTGCVDFPRMKAGGLHAIFFVAYTAQGPRNDSGYFNAKNRALYLIDKTNESVNKYNSMAEIAYTADDAYRIKKSGKIAVYIGVENGNPIGRDITKVKEFYDLGARYITLSHTRNNDICDSANDASGAEHNGLSEFGKQVIQEMNRLGMMIDVSHISDKSFYDILALTKAPVIASHSSCRALCNNPRNLTDDMLLALKENGGVIQICILSAYLISAELKRHATVVDVVDHIDHVVRVAGIDHVGIGTDFDGGGGIEGCRNASEVKNITIELLRRGYSKKDIEKIWSGNIMRVMRQVERGVSD